MKPATPRFQPERGIDRSLHRLYFTTAGFFHWLSRRLRPAGAAVAVVFIFACTLGMGHERTSIYQLFALCFGMMVVALPWAFFRRSAMETRRVLPKFATAGEPLRYSLQVKNTGKRRISRAWLADCPPDPRPSLPDFSTLREPGEETRNAFDRHFAYYRWQWLLLGNRGFTGGLAAKNLILSAGESTQVSMEITPLRRGVIRLADVRVLLPDPIGLFQRCRKVPAPPATLTVLPRRFPLPKLELPGNTAFKISGEANTNTLGSSGEFVGLRDYRPGDPLRQIHWKSWARTGRPIVKELEDTFYPRFGLVVDTFSEKRTDLQFEEIVSVAASFAAALDTSDSLLDLMFIKEEAHRVTAGRGVERAEKLLEVLAGVTAERVENYQSLAQLILRHNEDLTCCLIILNGWDATRAEFLKSLTRRGILCVPLIVGIGPASAGTPGHWLESGKIAESLQRLPSRLTPYF